jgi:hypothetical protein
MSGVKDFKTLEYEMGFSRGFCEGRAAAFDQFRDFITTGFATAPQKIIVTTEEFERIKNGVANEQQA